MSESLEWSKQYVVFSVSKLDLQSMGIPFEQVNALTDEDMSRIAEHVRLQFTHIEEEFEESVRIAATMQLEFGNLS